MKNRSVLSVASLLVTFCLTAWKSPTVKGEQPIFFGTLTTQEDNIFNVTNVTVGYNRTDNEKIVLYEKPKNLAPSKGGNIITVNPSENLTTVVLELQKISKLSVPHPHTIWTWTNNETQKTIKPSYEYIEVIITWRSGSSSHYLVELGLQDTRRPIKIFCDVIDKKEKGILQNGTLFCPGVKKTEVYKKGAPFQSIKELILEEPCYQIPTTNSGETKDN